MFQARFRSAARAFLRDPSEAGIRDLLASYALLHVATNGSEAGLDAELKRIEGNARNVLAGLP
jgi:hypothetical protein